jgi:hypothetical protein
MIDVTRMKREAIEHNNHLITTLSGERHGDRGCGIRMYPLRVWMAEAPRPASNFQGSSECAQHLFFGRRSISNFPVGLAFDA